jgi:hypothetical protein
MKNPMATEVESILDLRNKCLRLQKELTLKSAELDLLVHDLRIKYGAIENAKLDVEQAKWLIPFTDNNNQIQYKIFEDNDN